MYLYSERSSLGEDVWGGGGRGTTGLNWRQKIHNSDTHPTIGTRRKGEIILYTKFLN